MFKMLMGSPDWSIVEDVGQYICTSPSWEPHPHSALISIRAVPYCMHYISSILHTIPCSNPEQWRSAACGNDEFIRPVLASVLKRLRLFQAGTNIFFFFFSHDDLHIGLDIIVKTRGACNGSMRPGTRPARAVAPGSTQPCFRLHAV